MGERVLNVDNHQLRRKSPRRKLQIPMLKYLQAGVPIIDRVLKDVVLEVAEEDQGVLVSVSRGRSTRPPRSKEMKALLLFGLPAAILDLKIGR